jgi:hypothetical protein
MKGKTLQGWVMSAFIYLIPSIEDSIQGKPMDLQICIPSSESRPNSTSFWRFTKIPLAREQRDEARLQEVSSRSIGTLD